MIIDLPRTAWIVRDPAPALTPPRHAWRGGRGVRLLPAPRPRLCLPLPPAPPLLLSTGIAGYLADPGPRAVRLYHERLERDRLYATVAAHLAAHCAGLMLELSYTSRDAFYIRAYESREPVLRFAPNSMRSAFVLSPPVPSDRHGLPQLRPPWSEEYKVGPQRSLLIEDLKPIVNRHNIQGGFYTN